MDIDVKWAAAITTKLEESDFRDALIIRIDSHWESWVVLHDVEVYQAGSKNSKQSNRKL